MIGVGSEANLYTNRSMNLVASTVSAVLLIDCCGREVVTGGPHLAQICTWTQPGIYRIGCWVDERTPEDEEDCGPPHQGASMTV